MLNKEETISFFKDLNEAFDDLEESEYLIMDILLDIYYFIYLLFNK